MDWQEPKLGKREVMLMGSREEATRFETFKSNVEYIAPTSAISVLLHGTTIGDISPPWE